VSRLQQAVVIIFGVLLVCFFTIRLTGDPARMMVPLEAGEEEVENMRRALGFDQPLPLQFWRFLSGAVRGDFGTSLRFKGQPAVQLVLERFPATLELTLAAMTLSLSSSLVLGVISAVKRASIQDNLAMLTALLGQSIPTFWLGIMLILVFAVGLGWFPSSGRGEWRHLVLPAVTLGAYSMARTTRLVRSCLLEVLGQDYIRTARAKGLQERYVLIRHALKNAAIPVVTIVGLDFGSMLGGAVITETVFAWPGVGRLAVESIYARDFPVVLADVFFIALAFVLINLSVDMLYTWLDPRIRLR
jgi:ABC-type dipeptide/oligopeptide/nickel transport system permease component